MAAAERIRLDLPFAPERSLLRRWSTRCDTLNNLEALASCGLSPDGSPPSVMDRVYIMGGREREDAGGYEVSEYREPPDPELLQVDEFMLWYEVLVPRCYHALLARHRRLVRGRVYYRIQEWKLANLLYRSGFRSHHRLQSDCDLGYGALNRWLCYWRRREGISL